MVLSLILATVDELSSPEESLSDSRPVLTPLSFRYFPQPCFSSTRKRAFQKGNAPRESTFPTLRETMLHYIRTHPHGLKLNNPDRQKHLEDIGLATPLRLNVPFYLHYEETKFSNARERRKVTDNAPRVVYLTTATLVVVPPNLLAQWISEIHKHCDSNLRFLAVKSKDKFPPAQSLATNYDVSAQVMRLSVVY